MATKKQIKEEIEKKDNGIERRSISKELGEVLDRIKLNVDNYTWNSVRISDAEASKILAKKIIKAELDKEWVA